MKLNILSVAIAFIPIQSAFGAPPDLPIIGESFRFPPDQLILTETLKGERELHAVQTRKEEIKRMPPPVRPDNLVAAYQITGTAANTFFPLHLTVAKMGSFLTGDTLALLEKFEEGSVADQKPGGPRSPLGMFSVESASAGGIYLGAIRVPSPFEQDPRPHEKMAIICELRFEKENIDIRIARQLDLGHGEPLVPVAGGEHYFNTFGSPEPYDESPAKPSQIDYKACYAALARTLLDNYFKDHPSPEPATVTGSPGPILPHPPDIPGVTDKVVSQDSQSRPPQPPEHDPAPATPPASKRKLWIAGVLLLVALAAWGIRKACRTERT